MKRLFYSVLLGSAAFGCLLGFASRSPSQLLGLLYLGVFCLLIWRKNYWASISLTCFGVIFILSTIRASFFASWLAGYRLDFITLFSAFPFCVASLWFALRGTAAWNDNRNFVNEAAWPPLLRLSIFGLGMGFGATVLVLLYATLIGDSRKVVPEFGFSPASQQLSDKAFSSRTLILPIRLDSSARAAARVIVRNHEGGIVDTVSLVGVANPEKVSCFANLTLDCVPEPPRRGPGFTIFQLAIMVGDELKASGSTAVDGVYPTISSPELDTYGTKSCISRFEMRPLQQPSEAGLPSSLAVEVITDAEKIMIAK